MLDLSRLTAPQREAVLAGDGPLLVIAGPGSGKTLVLAARIAYLVTARRVPPTSVLALTFGTKAARELRQRLAELLGPAGRDVDVGTFHALGLRLVRQWGEALGWGPGPIAVYGPDEAGRLLRQAAAALEIDLERFPLRDLAARLERFRVTAGATGCAPAADPAFPTTGRLAELAERYEGLLRRHGAVDYPAMLALPLRLCAGRPDALRLLQDSYRHVLCDEGQDVCLAQYDLLRHLVARHRNLSVVGDPLQNLVRHVGAR